MKKNEEIPLLGSDDVDELSDFQNVLPLLFQSKDTPLLFVYQSKNQSIKEAYNIIRYKSDFDIIQENSGIYVIGKIEDTRFDKTEWEKPISISVPNENFQEVISYEQLTKDNFTIDDVLITIHQKFPDHEKDRTLLSLQGAGDAFFYEDAYGDIKEREDRVLPVKLLDNYILGVKIRRGIKTEDLEAKLKKEFGVRKHEKEQTEKSNIFLKD